MKITSSRRDDILKQKAEYESTYEQYRQDSESRRAAYSKAKYEAMEPVKQKLESKLAQFTALDVQVDVDRGHSRRDFTASNTVDVRIRVNDRNHFDENSALSWNYNVSISDGEVVKESSSWSGLKACTEAQMESLRQTVRALEWLNNIDWGELLVADFPDREPFYEGALEAPDRRNFNDELQYATISDLLGTNKFIKVNNFESSPYNGRYIWINPIGETNSQWKVKMVSDWAMENREKYTRIGRNLGEVWKDVYEQRVRKSTIHIPNIDNPEIIEV